MSTLVHRTRMTSARCAVFALALLIGVAAPALAADPVLSRVTPEGVQRGTERTINLYGARITDPKQLHWYAPGIETVKLELTDNKKFNHVVATIKIAPDAPLGEHFLRLRTADGWTAMRTLHVSELPIVNEIDKKDGEHNNSFDSPQKIPFGSTVHGRVDLEDVDYYAVELKKGQRITAEVEGIRLGHYLFDGYVAIMDSRRFELAASDDTPLLKQDPHASVVAPADGTYIVMIRESAYAGNANAVYRLHIGDLPRPTAVYPMGGQAGQSLKALMQGDPTGPWEQDVKLPDTPVGTWALWPTQGGKTAAAPFPYRVVSFPNVLEAEPDSKTKPNIATDRPLPLAFNGVIGEPGDSDWFRFTGKKGVDYTFNVYARSMGSPLDAVLYVYDKAGKQLQRSDDANNLPDPRLQFKLPADGEYLLRVRDHLSGGGPGYTYRVEVQPAKPRLSLSIPEVERDDTQSRQFAAIPQGGRWLTYLRASRQFFGGELKLIAENLPPGVTMHVPPFRGNINEVPVVFEAAADAPIGGTLAKLTGRHAENDKITGSFVQNVEWVQGEPNRTPYYTTSVEHFAVAVVRKAPFRVRIETPKTPLLQSGQTSLKIIVERDEGFDGNVRVQLPFRPPGVTATNQIDIPKGKTEGYYRLNASGGAAEGEWPIAVQAFATVGGGALFTASAHVPLKVENEYRVGTVQQAATTQGQTVQVLVKLEKRRDLPEGSRLELHGVPGDSKIEPIQLKNDAAEVVFNVPTTDKTPPGQHKSLFCSLVIPMNGSEMRQSLAGGGVLRVDKPRPKPAAKKPDPKKPAPAAKPAPKKEAPPKPLSRLEQLRLEAEQRAKEGAK